MEKLFFMAGLKRSNKDASGTGSGRKLGGRPWAKRKGLIPSVLVALVAVVFIALFFAVAFSFFDNAAKFVLCMADLVLCGLVLHKLTGAESYYGILLFRGKAGFDAMRFVARRFESACLWLADFGLALGFGLPYAVFAKKRQGGSWKRLAWQAAAVAAFFAFVFLSQTGVANSSGSWFFVLCLAAGLFGFGFYFLVQHAYLILTVPSTPPGVIPVVPGVTLPIEAVVAIIIIAVVHEMAHGVICDIVKLKIKSSGALLLGWLPIGAFVEPDEEAFKKIKLRDKRRILIAGSTSNALFFVLFIALAFAGNAVLYSLVSGATVGSTHYPSLVPKGAGIVAAGAGFLGSAKNSGDVNNALSAAASGGKMVLLRLNEGGSPNGGESKDVAVPAYALVIVETKKGFPAEGVLNAGEVVYAVDNRSVATAESLKSAIAGKAQGSAVTLSTSEGEKKMVLGDGGAIGAVFAQEPAFTAEDVPVAGYEWLYSLMSLVAVILYWTFLLNFVFASVNLLPIFITDGQRIFFEELTAAFGKRKGELLSLALGLLTLGLLVINALPWKTALGY